MRAAVFALLLVSVLASAGAALAQRPARMVEARADHAVAALEDGRLLVAGGRAAFEEGRPWAPLASVELYDGDTWRPSAPLSVARAGLRLTRLTDGRVLATGGVDGADALPVAELWDPRTERWTAAAPMREPRAHHVSVRLADGRVLVAGGASNAPAYGLASGEIYDPATDLWLAVGPMSQPRVGGFAAALGDGRVLVSGGYSERRRADDLDLFDPTSGTWRALGPPLGAIEAVIALADGSALVLGHARPSRYVADSRDARAVIFDPDREAWSEAGALGEDPWPRRPGLALLPDGRVIVAGGMQWRFPSARARDQAYAEACERVHVPETAVRSVAIWSPRTGRWSRAPDLAQPRASAAAALVPGTSAVLLTGGEDMRFDVIRRSTELVR